jgi:hypothetical protein
MTTRTVVHMSSAPSRRRLAAVLVGISGFFALAGVVHAREGVAVQAAVDGHELARSSPSRPVPLQGDDPVLMNVRAINGSSSDIVVRSVRLQGRVIGLTMFSYEARVDRTVAAGQTAEIEYEIELVDLARQAVGLIPARVELLDEDRKVLATQRFESDVDGSPRSVYGLFGIVVAAITGLLFVSAIVRLVSHTLPDNRWKRGMRFGVVGLGAGLTITFTLSAFGILFPAPGLWISLLLIGGVGMFVLGYLTPGPDEPRAEPEPDGDADDDRAALAAGRETLEDLSPPRSRRS